MPAIHSNLVFVGSRRIRGLVPAVNADEPLRKNESSTGGGASAYDIAVTNGFVGDEAAWLASLVGGPGTNGENGTDGTDGDDGANGLSAYAVAVANGFVGSQAAWLASLLGAPGSNGTAGRDFFNRRIQTVTGATGAVTCDWSTYDEIRLNLVGNVTLTFSGANDGQGCTLKLKQDATGSRTVALPANVRYSVDIPGFTATTTASKADRIGFINDQGDGKYDFVSLIKGF